MKEEKKKKIIKETEELNAINQLDLINIYRTLTTITADRIFFASLHETITNINHILGKNFLIEIMQSMFSDHTISITFGLSIMLSFQQKFIIILKKEKIKKQSKEAKQAAKPHLDLAEILDLSD